MTSLRSPGVNFFNSFLSLLRSPKFLWRCSSRLFKVLTSFCRSLLSGAELLSSVGVDSLELEFPASPDSFLSNALVVSQSFTFATFMLGGVVAFFCSSDETFDFLTEPFFFLEHLNAKCPFSPHFLHTELNRVGQFFVSCSRLRHRKHPLTAALLFLPASSCTGNADVVFVAFSSAAFEGQGGVGVSVKGPISTVFLVVAFM